jgi:hypothetical protein
MDENTKAQIFILMLGVLIGASGYQLSLPKF